MFNPFKKKPPTLFDARAAWEADKASDRRTEDYLHAIGAAYISGALSADEARAELHALRVFIAGQIGDPDFTAMVDRLVELETGGLAPIQAVSDTAKQLVAMGISPGDVASVETLGDAEHGALHVRVKKPGDGFGAVAGHA